MRAQSRSRVGHAVLRASAGLAAVLAVAACEPTIDLHGARLDDSAVAQIQPGTSTREDVVRLLGSPSALATFADDTWYYVSQRTEQMSFYQSEVSAQDVVIVRFDKGGTVTAVDRHGLDEAAAVDPIEATTPTRGTEQSILRDLLGNIGKFNPSPGRDSFGERDRIFSRRR